MRLRIGTRGSALARAQTGLVARALADSHPRLEVETVVVQTAGDRGEIAEGQGVFTSQLEQALLEGRVDLAVHSLKDLPTRLLPGLVLGCVPERADPRDALVSPLGRSLAELPAGTTVGSSSPRRQAQIRELRPDLVPCELSGNVDTRLARLAAGLFGAIVIAQAGLLRLGRTAGAPLPLEEMLPAPAQGALGLELRGDDEQAARLVACLEHAPTRAACTAERALLSRLEAGCHVPLGCLGQVEGETLRLRARVLAPDGSRSVAGERIGPLEAAETLGVELAERLLDAGADRLLATT